MLHWFQDVSLVYELLIWEILQEKDMPQQLKNPNLFVVYKSSGMGVTIWKTKLCLNFD